MGIICAFLFAVILSGAASAATTTHISSDGKNISITHNYVNSTLKTYATVKTGTGIYGYGKYITIKISGKDDQGRTSLRTIYSFNGIPKGMTYKVSSPGFYFNEDSTYGLSKVTTNINGRISPTLTFKGTQVVPFRYIGGQKCFGNGTANFIIYQNGKIFAKSSQTTTWTYKGFKGYYGFIKSVVTTKTNYANGNTRKSIVNFNYIRNSVGTLTGVNVSGKSQGTQKISSKLVNYTGIITIGTKYDPRDIMNEKFNLGDYKEVLTSTASKLLKFVPLESINFY